MDKPKNRWAWLPEHMPGVAKLMAERRRQLGDAHVNECWAHGVVKCEPGWFYAREGALAVGVPFPGEQHDATFDATLATFPTQALLRLRDPENGHA